MKFEIVTIFPDFFGKVWIMALCAGRAKPGSLKFCCMICARPPRTSIARLMTVRLVGVKA